MVHWWQVADALDRKLAALKGHEAVPGVTAMDWSKLSRCLRLLPYELAALFDGFSVKVRAATRPFRHWNVDAFSPYPAFLAYGGAQKGRVSKRQSRHQRSGPWTRRGGRATTG